MILIVDAETCADPVIGFMWDASNEELQPLNEGFIWIDYFATSLREKTGMMVIFWGNYPKKWPVDANGCFSQSGEVL